MTLPVEISILVASHVFLAGIGWWYGKFVADKRKIRQYYKGLKPVIRKIAELRKDGFIDTDQTRELIRILAISFKDNFEIGNMLTIEFGEYDNQTQIACGICGDEEQKIARNNLCSNCDLNCSIWNFS